MTTDKAKKLWADYGLPGSENSLPLAKKEFVEVTGITKQGEDAVTVLFTWKFVPNQISKYFDSSTTEFKSLPVDIQERMLGKQPATILNRNPKDETIKFTSEARQGQAILRRFDDGWRLESVSFQ